MRVSLDVIVGALADARLLVERRGDLPMEASGVVDDSRRVTPGSIFVAVQGTTSDGHDFLGAAAEQGASMAIVQDPTRTTLPSLIVSDARRSAAVAAAAAYGWPTRHLQLVGVTGTNGKTTTVNLLRHLLDEAATPSASIGTLGVLVGSEGKPLSGGDGLTTPGPVELQRLFRDLVDAGVRRVAMEVSSHALDQHRIEGVTFDVAVFTNLTHDHLDYHGTMEAYFAAKARLVDALGSSGTMVVNLDDPAWRQLDPTRRRLGYGERDPHAQIRAEGIHFTERGSRWTLCLPTRAAQEAAREIEVHDVELPLIGDFNISNALAASGAAWALGVPGHRIASRLFTVPQVPGRLELVWKEPPVLRDYAHTPDALARALDAVRPFTPGRIIAVFGCGGDRDRAKRPEMGAIAESKADVAIVTSDNPRTEDPERILDEIEAGMHGQHERIEDRRTAIIRALELARRGDVIVLAGKGHETYQIRGTRRLPFDEKQIVAELAPRYAVAAVSQDRATPRGVTS